MNENSVIFKGTRDGILIMLDKEIPFTELKKILKEKTEAAKKFFNGAKTSVIFRGRELTEDEEMELLDIVSKTSGLNISFVTVESNSKDGTKNKIVKTLKKIISAEENIATFHKGSVRGGQLLNFSGSIVVIGDVNPGGKIIAEGNVIILGTLKGSVHAGSSGNSDCFIAALNMRPTQLRIGDLITCFPEVTSKRRKISPEYAYINDGIMYVEPLSSI